LDRIPPPVIARREQELLRLRDRLRAAYLARCQGQERQVLWEERVCLPEGGEYWTGLTDTYVRVYRPAGEASPGWNRLEVVRLARPFRDGFLAGPPGGA